MAKLNQIIFSIFIIILAGCSAKSQFIYDHPVESELAEHAQLVAVVMPVIDQREDGKEIDQIFADNPLQKIQKIIKEELIHSGYFSEVILLQEDQPTDDADISFVPQLSKMQWLVPDYDEMLGKTFIISILTGGIGGIAYGSGETDVIGEMHLKLEMIDIESKQVIHDKTYVGHFSQKMKKLNCDSPETKATVIGKSLKNAMKNMSSDLHDVFTDNFITGLEMKPE